MPVFLVNVTCFSSAGRLALIFDSNSSMSVSGFTLISMLQVIYHQVFPNSGLPIKSKGKLVCLFSAWTMAQIFLVRLSIFTSFPIGSSVLKHFFAASSVIAISALSLGSIKLRFPLIIRISIRFIHALSADEKTAS